MEKAPSPMNFSTFFKTTVALTVLWAVSVTSAFAEPWSFGVISDTQWSGDDDGMNPNSVAAGIIRQVNQQFIEKGVRLVVAVGDTVDKCSNTSLQTRALYTQGLYNAGIAFYPLRGNHEAAMIDSGLEFARVFPQIGTGVNNNTPADIVAADIIPAADMTANPPMAKSGTSFVLGTHFSAPKTNEIFHSVSYSFDYNNVRFVLLDQFDNTPQTKNSTIALQQDWISQQLADPQRPAHAFVFGHKNILGSGSKDNIFGNHTGSDPGDVDPAQHAAQNAFVASLAQNRVHYYISGHDHHHYDSIVTSPDGKNSVHQIICASDSNRFYGPRAPFSANDKPVSMDLGKIGYYIYTVDGPCVTVDYYGVDMKEVLNGSNGIATTPKLIGNWKKLWSSGYSLNGTETAVPQGGSYAGISGKVNPIASARGESRYQGTQMSILSGTNGSTLSTSYGKALTKAVNIGWAPTRHSHSDILYLWGMSEIGFGEKTGTYVLSMSFDHAALMNLKHPFVTISTPDSNGHWNPAGERYGGESYKHFVEGPWTPDRVLGDYGIDATEPGKLTAWVVIDYCGTFAVMNRTDRDKMP